MNQRGWAKRFVVCVFCLGVVLSSSRLTVLVAQPGICDIDGDQDIDRTDIEAIVSARNTSAGIDDPRDVDGDGTITVNDARLCTLRCTKPRCSDSGIEVTQTFTDLQPTQPQEDEIAASPVDLDSGFPPEGPPVEPGPPVAVDSTFWEEGRGTIEELEKLFEGFEQPSAKLNQPLLHLAQVRPQPEGRWQMLRETTGVPGSGDIAIHAALLRSTASASGAEILFFAGDAHDLVESQARRVDRTGVFRILQPRATQFPVQKILTPRAADGSLVDLFCSGHAQLGDGRLLVAGGTVHFPESVPDRSVHKPFKHFTATQESFIFDPKTNRFDRSANRWSGSFPMNSQPEDNFEPMEKGGGRWYPTLLTLNSNEVIAFWGHPTDEDTRHTNDTPEIFRPQRAAWEFLGRESDVRGSARSLAYPRIHLLPNGRVFRATPMEDRDDPKITMNVQINPIPESLTNRDEISVRVSHGPPKGYGIGDFSYSSVLLPLTAANKYKARILLVGGPVIQPHSITLGTDTGVRLPPLSPEEQRLFLSSWSQTGTRTLQRVRYHANATILPTGEVLVSGGKFGDNLDQTAVLEGEIYNPFSKDPQREWRTVAPARVRREYHSVALLMPDGRIWHAGTSRNGAPGKENQEVAIDLYEPWYYSLTRPIISSMTGARADPFYPGAPLMNPHDSGSRVQVTHFRPVRRFALVRAGSVTHAFNSDQRYIELQGQQLVTERFQHLGFTFFRFTFRLTSPPSSSITPPGNYLLFAIDDLGVPSVGRFIRIDRQFVGELKQEAEDFTSRSQRGVSMRDDKTLFLTALREPVFPPPQPGEPLRLDLLPFLEYGGIDFGTAEGVVTQFSARVSSSRGLPRDQPPGGEFVVHLDKTNGPQIATLRLPDTNGEFVEQTTSLTPVSGVHNVFIRFTPHFLASSGSATVDWFKFKQQTGVSPVPGPPPPAPQPVQP